MKTLAKFIHDNPRISVNIVPTGNQRNMKLVVLVDNAKYKKLVKLLKRNGDIKHD